MTLLVLGITHHTAPLSVLDDLALTAEDSADLAAAAVRSPNVTEAMVLATCNRLEIVADVIAFHASAQDLAEDLAKAVGLPRNDLLPHLQISYSDKAARHLYEVAAGLDSMVVGEQQIIGQVRSALRSAQDSGTAARRLNAVTQAALRAAKRIHTETGIDRQGASIVSVGLQAAADAMPGQWSDRRVVVLGAGAMSSLAVATLSQFGVGELTVLNRSVAKAQDLAASYGATAGDLGSLADEIGTADLLVTCTGSTDLVVRVDDVAAARGLGADPLTVLDLALPHDSDPGIAHLPGVTRLTLADLGKRPEAAAGAVDVAAARRLLEEELAEYLTAEERRRLDPLVVSLRGRAGEFVEAEANRLRARLPHLSADEHEEIENGLRRAVNALLHTPTVRVKELAGEPDGHRYADALHSLFDLPSSVIEALGGAEQPEEEGWW